jgi:hypothetical protein
MPQGIAGVLSRIIRHRETAPPIRPVSPPEEEP